MNVPRSQLVSLFATLGYSESKNWTREQFAQGIYKLADCTLVNESQNNLLHTLIRLRNAGEEEINVVGSDPTLPGAKPSGEQPVAKPEPKASKAKKPHVPVDSGNGPGPGEVSGDSKHLGKSGSGSVGSGSKKSKKPAGGTAAKARAKGYDAGKGELPEVPEGVLARDESSDGVDNKSTPTNDGQDEHKVSEISVTPSFPAEPEINTGVQDAVLTTTGDVPPSDGEQQRPNINDDRTHTGPESNGDGVELLVGERSRSDKPRNHEDGAGVSKDTRRRTKASKGSEGDARQSKKGKAKPADRKPPKPTIIKEEAPKSPAKIAKPKPTKKAKKTKVAPKKPPAVPGSVGRRHSKEPTKPNSAGRKVIPTIVELLRKAGKEKKPISKPLLLERMQKLFPERPASSLKCTVGQQVPSKITRELKLRVRKNELGYWIN